MRKVTYTNSRGDSIILGNAAPFILCKIGGTGGVKADIQSKKAPSQDGYTYIDSTLEERQITMECAILGGTPEDKMNLRRKAAQVFNPKLGPGILKYEYSGGVKEISAISEEAPVYPGGSDNVSPTFQKMLITLICPNPFWTDELEAREEIALWLGDFQFDLEIVTEGIEMGHRVSNLIVNVNNPGDVQCGMRIEFKALATVVNPSILNVYTQEFIKVKRTLAAGDKLVVNTTFGNKTVDMIHSGVATNVLNWIDLSSTFIQLNIGDNLLRYDAEQGIDNLEVAIYYRPQYVGV